MGADNGKMSGPGGAAYRGVNKMPGVRIGKGIVHHAVGNNEKGNEELSAAARSLLVSYTNKMFPGVLFPPGAIVGEMFDVLTDSEKNSIINVVCFGQPLFDEDNIKNILNNMPGFVAMKAIAHHAKGDYRERDKAMLSVARSLYASQVNQLIPGAPFFPPGLIAGEMFDEGFGTFFGGDSELGLNVN